MRFNALLVGVALSGITNAQVPSYVPFSGLIGWWPFNGNANDESGGGNDGTLFGPLSTQDRNGTANSAYDFDGTSSYIAIPNIAVQGTAPRTYSFWMRTGNQVGGMMLCTGSGTNQDGGTFNMRHENDGQFIGFMGGNFWTGGHDYFPTGNVVVNNQQWHHVVTTYDGTTLAFYLDGSFEKSTTGLVLSTADQTNYVGRSNDQNAGNEAFFEGQVDDIGAWDRVLTPQEILDLFNALGGTPCVSSTPVSFSGLSGGYSVSDSPATLIGSPANGVFIGPGIAGNTFNPALAGEGTHGISYVVLDENGCVNSYALCTDVMLGMGLNGPEAMSTGVRVYPNPSQGHFTVELELQGLVSLQVFDPHGAAVHSEVFQASGVMTVRRLDLSKLAIGTYTIQVRNAGGTVSQKVVVE